MNEYIIDNWILKIYLEDMKAYVPLMLTLGMAKGSVFDGLSYDFADDYDPETYPDRCSWQNTAYVANDATCQGTT